VNGEAKALIRRAKKRILYTYGYEHEHPTTYKVPITKANALDILDMYDSEFINLDDMGSYIYLKVWPVTDNAVRGKEWF